VTCLDVAENRNAEGQSIVQADLNAALSDAALYRMKPYRTTGTARLPMDNPMPRLAQWHGGKYPALVVSDAQNTM